LAGPPRNLDVLRLALDTNVAPLFPDGRYGAGSTAQEAIQHDLVRFGE